VEQGASSNLGARLAAGEEGAINECYAALGPMVLGYLRRFVPRDEAEDVLQRVFYEVWRNRDRYDPTRSLEAWVLGIARKRAIDLLRRRHANVVPIEELRYIAGDDGRDLAERYVRASEVRGALERLSPEQREVLALAYFGELTQTEIADRLGVTSMARRQSRSRSGDTASWAIRVSTRPRHTTIVRGLALRL
jgi:RNA polymerase sigma factor (sigma-70 family)